MENFAYAWKKRTVTCMTIVVILLTITIGASGCGRPAQGSVQSGNGHYYTVEQAREKMIDLAYKPGADIAVRSEDGDFYYKVELEPEEYEFLTVTGYVEFAAKYSDGIWHTSCYPQYNYVWKISGSWYAKTEHYDVYMDIKSYNGSNLRLVLEAQYDGADGNKGSYGKQDQMVTLGFVDRQGKEPHDVCLTCELSGGYPAFTLCIEKDSMRIWQGYDNYEAEFVPN